MNSGYYDVVIVGSGPAGLTAALYCARAKLKIVVIKVTSNMETNLPGVFAAGDVRSGSVGQVVSAAGDGAIAAISLQGTGR